MSMSINTNTAAMSALQVLNQTTDQLSKTQNAVSTGKSVSSASDSPAIYAISQTMNSQISALSGVSTGLQFAGQVLSTASSQASSISTVLSSMSETVTNAANNGEDQDTLNSQLSSYLSQIDVATSNSTFQGVNLLSGSTSNSVKYTQISAAQDINGNLFTMNGADATSTGLGLQGLSTDMKGTAVDTDSLTLSAKGDATAATTLTLKNQASATGTPTAANPAISTSFILDAKPGDSTDGSASAVGSAIAAGLTTADTTVTVGANGALTISGATSRTTSDGTTTYSLTGGDTITAKADASGNMTYSVAKVGDLDANGNAKTLTKVVDVNVSGASSNTTKNDQLATLVTAIGNDGFGASLANDGTLTIAGGNLDATKATVTNAGDDSATATSTTSGTDVVQLAVTGAINKMSRISSSLGVASNTVTQLQTSNSTLSDALTTGVGALTDADLAAESAKLTSLQTKQQLAIQSLSIANSQSSNIMSLFRG
ncbi:flagellin B [Gluconobacter thailandicus]|uniref:flagellin N-terminal helical domain-containing protein n=1 Tax=Gluconobacter thailandicus TaxID=257438 RepID=UPI000776D1C0|nr:flagellin [Gluconobacter thailandicus]KXV32976.1 flagellin B [Gluconobacter thailandicus]